VPLYFRIPNVTVRPATLSHVDLMPTLLDAAAGITSPVLFGQSALRPKTWPYTVITRFNAGRAPYEFCLHNGKHKLLLQFANRKEIFASKDLRILSMRSCKDKCLADCKKDFEQWIEKEFGPAFDRLFQ